MSQNKLCDLSHFGLIAISGTDSESFLQGQVTNDVSQLTSEHSMLAAYCSPKGRMLACFRMFKRNDVYYLRLPIDTLEPTLKRLRMFVLMAKAQLEQADMVGIGLAGADADNLLADVDSDLVIIKVPDDIPRYEIYGESAAINHLREKLENKVELADSDYWRLLDIRAGIPNVYAQTSDAFVPQMANLDLFDGINYKKGCYVGQEIVARTHYLGKLKKRMYQVNSADQAPIPNTDLFAPDKRGEQSVGQIVDAVETENGFEATAVIVIECAEQSKILLGDVNGSVLSVKSLT